MRRPASSIVLRLNLVFKTLICWLILRNWWGSTENLTTDL